MNLKTESLKALAAYLEAQVPELVGRVFVGVPDEEQVALFPSLTLIPGQFKFEPFQETEFQDSDDPAHLGGATDKLVIELGDFNGNVELYLTAKTKCEREALEQEILDAFLQRELAPGIITLGIDNLSVMGLDTTLTSTCAFALEDDHWQEEKVFSKKRLDVLDITCWFTVYAARTAYTIDQLILAMTEDFAAEGGISAGFPMGLGPIVPDEEFQINQDGTTTEL